MKDSENTKKAGRIMQFLGWSSVFLFLISGAATFVSEEPIEDFELNIIIYSIILVISFVYIYVGSELKKNKGWAKVTTLILALLALIYIPIGTILSIVILVYLFRGWNETGSVT